MEMNIKKITLSGMMIALTVALSGFSIPIGASKCFPIQHMMNVLAAVFLGPVYGVSMAFVTSVIRNLLGTGSLLAFPGSMVGALLCALIYKATGKLSLTYMGEILGTGIIGATLCYPIAIMFMGKEVAMFFFVIPFLMSTVGGTAIAAILVGIMTKSGIMSYLKNILEGQSRVKHTN